MVPIRTLAPNWRHAIIWAKSGLIEPASVSHTSKPWINMIYFSLALWFGVSVCSGTVWKRPGKWLYPNVCQWEDGHLFLCGPPENAYNFIKPYTFRTTKICICFICFVWKYQWPPITFTVLLSFQLILSTWETHDPHWIIPLSKRFSLRWCNPSIHVIFLRCNIAIWVE